MKVNKRYGLYKRNLAMFLVFMLIFTMVPHSLVMGASTIAVDVQNLLSNPTFEETDLNQSTDGLSDKFGNWYASQGLQRVEGTAHEGNWSVKLAAANDSLEQDVDGLQAGLTYEYSVWVKADDASKGSLKLGANHDGNESMVAVDQNEWTKYSLEFTATSDRVRLNAMLESNEEGNNFYVDNASLTVKSDIKQVSVANGSVTVEYMDTFTGTPSKDDFVITYSSSLEPEAIVPLIINDFIVSDNKILAMNFEPLAAQPMEQTVTVYVKYQTNPTMTLDFQIAATEEEIVTATVQSLTATNGSLSAFLNEVPTVAPLASDFTFAYKINDGEFSKLDTSDFAYDSDSREVNFNFDRLPSSSEEQTVTVKVTHQEMDTTGSFTIGAGQSMTYYVSSTGSDDNNGLTPETPFQTIDKLNTIEFQPGDHILFKKGDQFQGAFKPKGSGKEGAPIVVASYGEGDIRPVIKPSTTNWTDTVMSAGQIVPNATINNVITFYNQQYWEVRDLELSGPNSAPDALVFRRGINVVGEDAGDLNHFYFDNLVIHGFHGPNSNIGKSSGGIMMEVKADPSKPVSEHIPTSINDIRITNSELYDLGRSGVNFLSVWARRAETDDTKWGPYYTKNHAPRVKGYEWKPYEDFYLANNLIYDIDGDGAIIDNNKDAVVENNLVFRTAKNAQMAVGLFNWNSDNTVFQFNEVYDVQKQYDAQGIEIDALNDTTYVQYNYFHDNVGGTFMWCNTRELYGFDGVFRYNISQNDDTKHGVIDWRPGTFGAQAYNNTIYMKDGGYKKFMDGSTFLSEADFYNNIFYYPGDKPFVANKFLEENIDWQNNLFYNFANTPSNDSGVITADPMFVDPGKGGTGVGKPVSAASLEGYKLKPGSPAINAGIPIENNGGRDYFGNPVSGIPDIGAYDSGTVSLTVGSAVYTIDQADKTITVPNTETLTVESLLSNLFYDEGGQLKVYREGIEISGSDAFKTGDTLKLLMNGEEVDYTISIVHDPQLLAISSDVYTIDDTDMSIAVPQEKTTTVDELLGNLTYRDDVTVRVFHGANEITGTQTVVAGDIVKLSKGEYQAVYMITAPHDAASDARDIPVENLTATAGSVQSTKEPLYALDGQSTTLWHSLWAGDKRENLHITISLKDDKPYMVDGLRYLPRSSGGNNGIITKYKIQYSTNGTDFIDVPGGIGNWSMTGWQDVQFAPVAAKAIRLHAVDSVSGVNGELFASAAEIRLTGYGQITEDTTAPGAPAVVIVDNDLVTENSVVVRWTAPTDDDVIGYNVYVNDGKGDVITYVNNASTTFARILGLNEGIPYTVTVTAIDGAGNESVKSDPASIAIDSIKPTAPMNLVVSNVGDSTATVTWDASTDNVGVTGYEVYKNDILIDTVIDTSYNLMGLSANTSYNIKVRAVDANGNESSFVLIIVNTTADITNPTWAEGSKLTATNIDSTNLTLNWSAATDNTAVTSYKIYQGNRVIAEVAGDIYAFNVTGLKHNTSYTFKVEASDADGNLSAEDLNVTVGTKHKHKDKYKHENKK